jgi:hypothetical protein
VAAALGVLLLLLLLLGLGLGLGLERLVVVLLVVLLVWLLSALEWRSSPSCPSQVLTAVAFVVVMLSLVSMLVLVMAHRRCPVRLLSALAPVQLPAASALLF